MAGPGLVQTFRLTAADLCPPGGARWTDGRCVPEGLLHARGTWVVDVVVPAVCSILVVLVVADCIRKRRLTWWLLLAVASSSCFWLETFGDWGQHLSYSPRLAHYTVDWAWSAPHNPTTMPLLYAAYWVAHAWAILRAAQWLQRRRPGMRLGGAILVLSAPLTFVWNLIVEGNATYFGLWTYDPPIGPSIHFARGNWPLTWPVFLLFGWINLIAWVVGPPEEDQHFNRLERCLRLDRLLRRPGWTTSAPTAAQPGGLGTLVRVADNPATGSVRYQVVRLLGWILFFNVTFVLTLDLPLVAVRVLTGWGSPFLP